MTKSQTIAADVAALLRARNPLLWIVSREEARVERYVAAAAASAKYDVVTWDVAAGFCDAAGEQMKEPEGSRDLTVALDFIRNRADGLGDRTLWIMRDLPGWLSGMAGASTLRQLRNLARALPEAALESTQAIVVLSPAGEVPPELSDHATVIEWPLPDREEIGEALNAAMATGGSKVEPLNGKRDAAVDAAVGLTEAEAVACFGRSLVQLRAMLLCPEVDSDKLDAAVVEARKIIDEFNGGAQLSSIGLYVLTGRVMPDDVEAVRAINSEIRELMAEMAGGVENGNVDAIREAATRVRGIGEMLATEAQTKVEMAVKTARDAAKQIVRDRERQGSGGTAVVDRSAVKRINELRTAFLDLDDEAAPVAAPKAAAGAQLDFAPAAGE